MIRSAAPADATVIAQIWNHAIRDTTITFTTVEKTNSSILEMIASRPVFVAQDQDVIGFATYGPFRSGPGYAHVAEHSIHLAPDSHRRGLGRALMAALECRAVAQDFDTLIGAMTGDNQTSIAFHQACGFRQVGFLPQLGAKFGTRHDLVLMQKQLHVTP